MIKKQTIRAFFVAELIDNITLLSLVNLKKPCIVKIRVQENYTRDLVEK